MGVRPDGIQWMAEQPMLRLTRIKRMRAELERSRARADAARTELEKTRGAVDQAT